MQFNNESGITEIIFSPSIKAGQIVSMVIPSVNPKQGVYECGKFLP